MAEAILMLSDRQGAVELYVSYEGPIDPKSPAHQHMQLLLKAMDTIAQRIPDAEPVQTEVAEASRLVIARH